MILPNYYKKESKELTLAPEPDSLFSLYIPKAEPIGRGQEGDEIDEIDGFQSRLFSHLR